MALQIGILETGTPREAFIPRFGRYDAMVRALLGSAHTMQTFAVAQDVFPAAPDTCDAYVITGSPAGVYDPLPWIARLKTFIREAEGSAAMVGLCFGHQVMAEAYGGRVEKSAKGWGLGLHDYAIFEQAPWTDGATTLASPASHQDQVVAVPDTARVIGGSAFTPYGILAYPDRRALSFQFHPEFEPAYAAALVDLHRADLDPGEADRALESLQRPSDGPRVARWITAFLNS